MLPFLFLQSLANDVARELVIECDILYPLKLGTDPVVGPTDKGGLFSQIDMIAFLNQCHSHNFPPAF
jgi:hypothetical protein